MRSREGLLPNVQLVEVDAVLATTLWERPESPPYRWDSQYPRCFQP